MSDLVPPSVPPGLGPDSGDSSDGPKDTSDAPTPMRGAVVRGGLVMAMATVFMRASSFLAQLVLGRILLPEDFGVYAIALSFVAIASSLRSVLRPYLVDLMNRGIKWGSFYRLVMWSVLVSSALAACCAPLIAGVFDEPSLRMLLVVMFLSVPVQVYPVFGLAVLNHGFEFTRLGKTMAFAIVIRQIATVAGALLGLGPLAFGIGVWAGAIFECVGVRRLAGKNPSLWGNFDMSEVRAGGRALRWLPISVVALAVWVNGDYGVAALFESATVVGLYFFAYQLTTALAQPVTTAAQSVLVPSFGRLGDAERAKDSFLETVQVVPLLAGFPFGVLAVVAAPLIHQVWGGRWDDSAFAVIVLAAVIPLRLIHSVTLSVIQARGDWKRYATLVSISAVSTVIAAALGGLAGGLRPFVVVMAVSHVFMALAIACAVGVDLDVPIEKTLGAALFPWASWALAVALVQLSTPLLDTSVPSVPFRLVVFTLSSLPIVLTLYSGQLSTLVSLARSRGPSINSAE